MKLQQTQRDAFDDLVNGLRTGDMTTIGMGDLDFNGITNIHDLVLMQDALITAGIPPISGEELVPEPNSLVMLLTSALIGLGLLRRR